jgi:hypothetical protein
MRICRILEGERAKARKSKTCPLGAERFGLNKGRVDIGANLVPRFARYEKIQLAEIQAGYKEREKNDSR